MTKRNYSIPKGPLKARAHLSGSQLTRILSTTSESTAREGDQRDYLSSTLEKREKVYVDSRGGIRKAQGTYRGRYKPTRLNAYGEIVSAIIVTTCFLLCLLILSKNITGNTIGSGNENNLFWLFFFILGLLGTLVYISKRRTK